MMLRSLIGLIVVLFASGPTPTPSATERPAGAASRVVSMNVCADQLLLLLADPDQIAALSNLSRDSAASLFHAEASHFPQVRPVSEHVLAQQPDLVISTEYGQHHTIGLLREVGVRVETLRVGRSIDDMMSNLQQVAGWLGKEAEAAALTQTLRDRLAVVHAASGQSGPTIRAAIYDTNGFTAGDETLRGDMLSLAGFHNVATDRGIAAYGVLSLETLIVLRPDVLVHSPFAGDAYSRGQQLTQHRAIGRTGLAPQVFHLPSSNTICAGPWNVDGIEQLYAERLRLQAMRAEP